MIKDAHTNTLNMMLRNTWSSSGVNKAIRHHRSAANGCYEPEWLLSHLYGGDNSRLTAAPIASRQGQRQKGASRSCSNASRCQGVVRQWGTWDPTCERLSPNVPSPLLLLSSLLVHPSRHRIKPSVQSSTEHTGLLSIHLAPDTASPRRRLCIIYLLDSPDPSPSIPAPPPFSILHD